MIKKSCFTSIFAGFVALLVLAESAGADLANGEFIDDLSPWIVSPLIVGGDNGVVWIDGDADGDGEAKFIPDLADSPSWDDSTLSQIFTLDPQSLTLSFDFRMGTVGDETDIFTASLLDTTVLENPLVFVSGETYFYYFDSVAFENKATEVFVSVIDNIRTVSLDVSTWASEEVKLVFNLEHDYTEAVDTEVYLDNVGVSLVPVPGALVLGSIGLSLAGCWLGKRRTL